jgi:phosphomethylpyrimidine synthase
MDRKISECRQALDWEGMISHCLDRELVRKRLQVTHDQKGCSMCGKLCAVSSHDRM